MKSVLRHRDPVAFRLLICVALLMLVAAPASAQAPSCETVNGLTSDDRLRALAFCERAIIPPGSIITAFAAQSRKDVAWIVDHALWLAVRPEFAKSILDDRANATALLRKWLEDWTGAADSASVSVRVSSRGVEIGYADATPRMPVRVTIW